LNVRGVFKGCAEEVAEVAGVEMVVEERLGLAVF